MKLVEDINNKVLDTKKVSDKEAEEAFKTILTWMGEDPSREGLLETPKRVVKAFKEYFGGYAEDANKILEKTFGDVEGYDDMVVEKNISVTSHCEHHMAPMKQALKFFHEFFLDKQDKLFLHQQLLHTN